MHNRVTQLFEKKKANILSIFFTAGYPQIQDTTTIIKGLDAAGVDLIEIGVPFSDPLADGPVIQHSSEQSLQHGMTLALLFEQLKDIRQHTQIPIVLMGYLNPVLQYGIENYLNTLAQIGIDGYIIPDLPLDYYESHFKTSSLEKQLSAIMLITNQTSPERLRQLDEASSGFLYMVSSNSITGQNKSLTQQEAYYAKTREMNLKNPTLLGFNIHNHETFETACTYCAGAIIGTAFLQHITKAGISTASIEHFIQTIRQS